MHITSYLKGQITVFFAPASLILANNYLPLNAALYFLECGANIHTFMQYTHYQNLVNFMVFVVNYMARLRIFIIALSNVITANP